MTQITDHLANIRQRVEKALLEAGREPGSVTIVAVSKQQPAAAIETAARSGHRHFGESYIQEAVEKMGRLAGFELEWHFIGRVQANKTRSIAERFQWVHAVDRSKIAARLDEQRPPHAPPLNVLIQVNQSGDPLRAGIAEPGAAALAEAITHLPRLKLRGLMTITPAGCDARRAGDLFARLRALKARLDAGGIPMDTLSMGMSADFEAAIAAGSTCVRIGTAIFGSRAAD